MALEMKNYLYHGLNYCNNGYKTLKEIFDSGYILTRKSLKQYLEPSEYQRFARLHKTNWNGMDAVSVSCHPENMDIINKYNLTINHSDSYNDFNNSYKEMVRGKLALILDPILLEDFELKLDSMKMNYELQILGDIPIKYVKAIGMNLSKRMYKSEDLFNLRNVLLELSNNNKRKNFFKYCDNTWYIREDLEQYSVTEIFYKYMSGIYHIQQLLQEYELNIPIVDMDYGYELPKQDTQEKRLVMVEKAYTKYKKQ